MSLSWPTPESVLRRLPVDRYEPEDTETKGVKASDVAEYLAYWRHQLKQGSGAEPPPTPDGVGLVERGARSDALEQLYVAMGQDVPEAVKTLRAEVKRMLADYSVRVDLPGESDDDASSPGEDDGVFNFTDGALWHGEDAAPRSYRERGRWEVWQ